MNVSDFNTFEALLLRIRLANSFYCVLIYHSPSPNNGFLIKFAEFLSSVVVKFDSVYCFNMQVDDVLDKFSL